MVDVYTSKSIKEHDWVNTDWVMLKDYVALEKKCFKLMFEKSSVANGEKTK